MFTHQAVNLHLPMIFGAARDLRKQVRKRGLGQLDFGQGLLPSRDDWWQRYVYDTTQGALRVLGARYGEGEYYPVDDPRYRPNIDLRISPTLSTTPVSRTSARPPGEGIRLTNTQILLGVAGLLLFMQGKRGR